MKLTFLPALAAVLTAGWLNGATVADAAPTAVETYESVKLPGQCIDDSNRGLRSFGCNGTDFQKFSVEAIPNYRIFHNVATKGCIDDTTSGGLRARPCNGTPAQQFSIIHNADASITMKNRQTGRCIDDTSLGLRAWTCNGTVAQHFK